MALIYIFKYPEPGQEDGILNPSTGSAREEDIAIAMSRFSYIVNSNFFFLRKRENLLKSFLQLMELMKLSM